MLIFLSAEHDGMYIWVFISVTYPDGYPFYLFIPDQSPADDSEDSGQGLDIEPLNFLDTSHNVSVPLSIKDCQDIKAKRKTHTN